MGNGESIFSVHEKDVEVAELLEKKFQLTPDSVVDPPDDTPFCVSPKYYPDLFA